MKESIYAFYFYFGYFSIVWQLVHICNISRSLNLSNLIKCTDNNGLIKYTYIIVTDTGLDINVCPIPVKTDVGQDKSCIMVVRWDK